MEEINIQCGEQRGGGHSLESRVAVTMMMARLKAGGGTDRLKWWIVRSALGVTTLRLRMSLSSNSGRTRGGHAAKSAKVRKA